MLVILYSFKFCSCLPWASQVELVVKNPSANAKDTRDMVLIPGSGRSLEEAMATYSSILAWRIPWTEEPSRLQYLVCKESDRTKATWHTINRVKTWLVVSLIKWPRCASAAAKLLQSCLTLCDPIDGSPPGFPVHGILQEEHWSGVPFPSPMRESEKGKWSRSVVSDS